MSLTKWIELAANRTSCLQAPTGVAAKRSASFGERKHLGTEVNCDLLPQGFADVCFGWLGPRISACLKSSARNKA